MPIPVFDRRHRLLVCAAIVVLAGAGCHLKAMMADPGHGGGGQDGGGAPEDAAAPAGDATAPADGAPGVPSPRTEIDLDGAWRFFKGDVSGAEATAFDDHAWTAVTLPHTWNNLDGQMGGNAYYRGPAWYRRHLVVGAAQKGQRLYLQFDGANSIADVYVNGQSVGEHRGGYARFRFDVTSLLAVGSDNVIAVKVNNAFNADLPPLDADFTFFGGLYRDVHLLATSPVHISTMDFASPGVYLRTPHVTAQSADLSITTKLVNDDVAAHTLTVTARLRDADTVVQSTSATQTLAPGAAVDLAQSMTIANPHLWNGLADPFLYSVSVELTDGAITLDAVTQPLGVRTFAVDANNGFSLNGKSLDLHGVNRHQDRLDHGWAITDAQHDEDMQLIREIGANVIRGSHYEHAQHFYDLADRNGMVVWAEIPLIDYISTTTAFADNAKQQLKELIRQSYNHPSICFWSIANEIVLKPGPDAAPLLTTLGALAKSEDPTRLSTLATTDVPSDFGHTDVIGINKYYGWYVGSYNDFGAWIDGRHAALPTTPLAISEFGAGASIQFHSDTPVVNDHSEEYQALLHEAHWRAMKTRKYLWGKFIWNMFDFASSSRNEGDTPGRNDKGLVTYDRMTRKDAFYFYKANWTSAPFVYITSRRFTKRTKAATSIKVYSTLPSLEVKLNGISLGSKTGVDGVFTWPGVTLSNGQNTVDATGMINGASYADHVVWTLN